MISFWVLLSILSGSPFADRFVAAEVAEPQSRTISGPMIQVGEELEYVVRYSFFDIGTIRFRVISKEIRDDRPVYRTVAYMDSNPGLGWLLNLHIRFYGLMDSLVYSHTWVADDSTGDGIMFRSMVFDYDADCLYYTKGDRARDGMTSVSQNDTIPITGPSQDGMSLFFFAREQALYPWRVEVPTFMDTEEGMTRFNFTGQIQPIEIDAVQYPVRTVYLNGVADFVGVFGVTGEYEGWFSHDAARIPIFAKMKVILGSVEIELVRWSRVGWDPPRYEE